MSPGLSLDHLILYKHLSAGLLILSIR